MHPSFQVQATAAQPATRSRRLVLSCTVLAAALQGGVVAAQAVDPNAPLRAITLPGPGITVPGGSFQESPAVLKLCQPDSAREPVRDRAGRNYVSDAEFRQVMQQGRQLAEASDAWARTLGRHLLMQRQLPGRSTGGFRIVDNPNYFRDRERGAPAVPPETVSPQQADMNHNFAVLEARRGELEAAAEGYMAAVYTMELNALRSIAQAGLPPADVLGLLKQLDQFRDDDSFCVDERLMGRKASDALSQYGWPLSNQQRQQPTKAWHLQNAKKRQVLEEFDTEFAGLAAVVVADARARVAAQMQGAKTANELPRIMFSTFGSTELNRLAMADPEIQRSFEARSTALRFEEQKRLDEARRKLAAEEERRAAADRARILANVKNNGAPVLSDIQGIVIQQSLGLSIREGRGLTGVQTSPADYEMSTVLLGRPYKTAAVTLRVSDLSCKPERGMQRCTYTESFDWTRYAMFENVVLPRVTRVEKRSTLFKWTTAGLEVEGDFETRAVGWTPGGSSGGSGGAGRREPTFADQAAQRDRDNQQRYQDRVQATGGNRPVMPYEPSRQY